MSRIALACLLGPVLAPSAVADASAAVSVGIEHVGTRSRLVAVVSGPEQGTPRGRALSVHVRYGRAIYRLGRASLAPRSSRWRTTPRTNLAGLVGRRVTVLVRSRRGVSTVRRTVAGSRFRPPPRDATGDAGWEAVRPYFVNSQFTDCTAASCTAERTYRHCAGGGLEGPWRLHATPVALGPTAGTYRINEAFQRENGTWGVAYTVNHPNGTTSAYSWVVQPNGAVLGAYQVGETSGILQGLYWRQPAGC